MENQKLKNKIIVKFIIIVVILIAFIIILLPPLSYKNLPANTLMIDANLSTIENIYNYLEKFFAYVDRGRYEKAYNMLHDDCKEKVFNNSIEKFSQIMKSDYFDYKLCYKTVTYKFIKEYTDLDGAKINVIDCGIYLYRNKFETFEIDVPMEKIERLFSNKNVTLHVFEYAPLDYKIYMFLE